MANTRAWSSQGSCAALGLVLAVSPEPGLENGPGSCGIGLKREQN